MNRADRPAPDDAAPLATLFDALAVAPQAHDFFHTLRRIDALTPQAPRLGRALRASLEPVRLGQDAELDFAPAALSSFAVQAHAPPRLGVRFLGLFGPQGPLPLHLTEYARERERHHADPGFARFADLFHHRVLSLFYRAWAEAQPCVHADRPDDDRFAKWLSALFGTGPAPFRERDSVADAAKRYNAGTLARGVKNAEGLEALLRLHLRVPVRVMPFVGRWLRLREQDRTRLGMGHVAEPSAQLGRSAVAGSKVWDRQYGFRLCIGPLSLAQYQTFMPDGPALPVVRDWVRQYVGIALVWDLRLILAAAEVPPARLRSRTTCSAQPMTRLGLSSWLGPRRPGVTRCHGSDAAGHDRDDLILDPEAVLRAEHTARTARPLPEPHHA